MARAAPRDHGLTHPAPEKAVQTLNPVSHPARSQGRLSSVGLPMRGLYIALGVIALAGVLLVLSNTRWGAYLSDDSYYYIYPARDFAAGRGFNPSYIFAPLLPFVLAVVSLAGIDALLAIRWLNALLFGLNLLLVAHLIWQICRQPAFTLSGTTLVLLADVVVEAHGWAMSEALSFTWMLISLNGALLFITRNQQRYFWMAVLGASLTVLTRYAALPLIAAIALALLVFAAPKSLLKRLLIAAALAPPACCPSRLIGCAISSPAATRFATSSFSWCPSTNRSWPGFRTNGSACLFPAVCCAETKYRPAR